MKRKKVRRVRKEKSAKEKSGIIEFCSKCGAIMLPVKKSSQIVLKCRSCGAERKRPVKELRIVEEKKKVRGVVVLEKDDTVLPTTEKMCPKCENMSAYWWMQQTRSADEPPTQFFRCTKCMHVWREYK
jgi:DNA-directed RNA polymerase subunit M